MAKKALQDEGYQIVEVTFSPEDYAAGRNLLIGMVASGAGPGLLDDFEKSGEQKTLGTWSNLFLLSRGPVGRFLIRGILALAGMGRLKEATQEFKIRDTEDYGLFLKKKYEFQYAMSAKW